MIQYLPLLIAAAIVGILHMSAPDHWLTLAMLGKSQKWKHDRLFKTSIITGIGHVTLSLFLGFTIVGLGLLVSNSTLKDITYIIGLIMLVSGTLYAARALQNNEKFDYSEHTNETLKKNASYLAILGAALSPDLSVLPIFLIAIPIGLGFMIELAIVFTVCSLITLIIFVYLGHLLIEHSRFAKKFEKLHPKYNDALVGIVIAIVGIYVIVFG